MNSASDKKILVIEDEEALREAVVAALEREGFQVLSAADGFSGMSIGFKEHPDLILLDHLMPKMTGMGMLEALREDPWGARVKVIMTTNVNETEMVNKALAQNVKQYLVKSDISLDSMVEFVKETLGIESDSTEQPQA